MPELFAVPIEETVAPQPSTEANPAPEAAPIEGVAANPATPETDADPQNPNVTASVTDEPINLIEPPPLVVETAAQRADRLHAENNERRKREFTLAVLEARKPEVKPPVAQPVAPGMVERTAKEMAEGARMNKVHEDAKALRPSQVPSAREKQAAGNTTPVFRPADYVPDPVKGQGNVTATSV